MSSMSHPMNQQIGNAFGHVVGNSLGGVNPMNPGRAMRRQAGKQVGNIVNRGVNPRLNRNINQPGGHGHRNIGREAGNFAQHMVTSKGHPGNYYQRRAGRQVGREIGNKVAHFLG